jgi:hypothetical protein
MRLGAALLAASLILAATPSHANGRFPLAQRLFQDQGNPDHFVLSATFGLLTSRDHGESWYHICEGALTPELLESDPVLELMPDGSMLASLLRPLRRSDDCGCTWQPVLADSMDESLVDVAKAGGTTVLALVRQVSPALGFRIERSNDGGRTWSEVSALAGRLEAFTLDAAPSNPLRVYVSVMLHADPDAGLAQSTPALLVSDDGGVSFAAPRPIQGAIAADFPYIAAVDPADEATLYVRTDAWTASEDGALDEANDALFVSDDSGMQFREVLRKHAKLFGFALSPDGSKVLAGYGDPVQAARAVYLEDTGIYSASTTDFAFTQNLNAPVSCLTWNERGLYACFDEQVGVTQSTSVPATPDEFSPVLVYADVKGPLYCNATTCLTQWRDGSEDVAPICQMLAADCNRDIAQNVQECAPSAGGAAGSGSGGSAGSAGVSNGGVSPGGTPSTAGAGAEGIAGSGGASPMAGGSANSGAANASSGGGSCGCRSPGTMPRDGALSSLAALTVLALLGRAGSRRSTRRA